MRNERIRIVIADDEQNICEMLKRRYLSGNLLFYAYFVTIQYLHSYVQKSIPDQLR